MINCQKAVELSSRRLERALSLQERLALYLHVRVCVLCRRYAAQLRLLRRSIRRLVQAAEERGIAVGAALSADARERIVHALRSAMP